MGMQRMVIRRRVVSKPTYSVKKLVKKLKKSGFPLNSEQFKKIKSVLKTLKPR